MTDLSSMSNEELMAIVNGKSVQSDLSSMSDEELQRIASGGAQKKPFSLLSALGETWPAQAVKGAISAAQLPGDVYKGDARVPSSGAVPGSVPFGDPQSSGLRIADLAMLGTPINPAVRAGDRALPAARQMVSKDSFEPAGISTTGGQTTIETTPKVSYEPVNNFSPQKPVTPGTKELYTEGVKDLNTVANSDLVLPAAALSRFGQEAQQKLFQGSVHPLEAPATYAKLKELESAPEGSPFVTGANLKVLRESLGATAQNFNPNAAKDQLAASRAIKLLDEFVGSLGQKDVLAGDAAATAKLWTRGRGNYAAAQRSNDITGSLDKAVTGIQEQAELGAQVTNSGRNIDNKIRQSIASTLKKERDVSGLTESEIAALKQSAEGGKVRNAARYVGNLLGGGGGIGQTLLAGFGAAGGGAAGGAIGNPLAGALLGAAVPAATGAGSKSIANALAKRSLNKVDETLRQRSPLYQERVANPAMVAGDPAQRAALVRALLLAPPRPQQH